MDVPAAAAGPWLALGAVLGILLLVAAAAVAAGLRGRPPAAPPAAAPGPPRDDLADFLASPPGTPGARDDHGDGWAALAPAPLAPAAPPASRDGAARPSPGSRPGTALAALAVVALLLVGVAAALAAASRSPGAAATAGTPSATTGTPAPGTPSASGGEGVAARLAFGGVVLQEHAVGVTVARPELELTSQDGRTVARLRLPAANCLAASAPPRAGDPACRAARTEYAELSTPDLRVVRAGDELTVSGRFATELRPPGGDPQPTGRSYELAVTVAATGEERDGWFPAEGRLQWGDQVATTRADGPPSVLRPGG